MNEYSSVTLHLPFGFFAMNIAEMEIAYEKFSGLQIAQGDVSSVLVTGNPPSNRSVDVELWAKLHLPLA